MPTVRSTLTSRSTVSRSIRRSPRPGGGSWASTTTPGSTSSRPTGAPSSRRRTSATTLIIVDAYRQPYIPFYLATREFFRLARERLVPGGVLALNVAQVPGDDRLSEAIGSTLLAEFPQGWAWKPLRFNELMLGFDQPAGRLEVLDRARHVDPRIASLVPLFERQLRPVRTEVTRADRRPGAGGVADRPDDRGLHRGGWRRHRGGSPADGAVRLRAEDGRFLRIAHRGAAALAAENSLAAIEAGLAADVDLIEFDVLELEDGSSSPTHPSSRSRAARRWTMHSSSPGPPGPSSGWTST